MPGASSGSKIDDSDVIKTFGSMWFAESLGYFRYRPFSGAVL